ncbi:MAG TPA: peptidoglycan recognition family protein [Actinomycetes bacterium]|nr:peptidoglycan recognition family protein [Actinomycetes bacterium]
MPASSIQQKGFDLDGVPFIPARNYTPASRDQVALVVLHSMESQEKPGTARRVAEWFAGENAPRASAHYCVDADVVVRCVRDQDIAWHAPGANSNGIGIEHAGRAAQTRAEWSDAYSMAVLERSLRLAVALCLRWSIPPRLVTPTGLVAGEHGITTHAYVSEAFRRSSHTDPGPGFPLSWYLRRVEADLQALRSQP